VVGFGGRVIGNDDNGAKYLNGPETLVYKKGHTVFAIDRARDEIRRGARAVVVEGFVDAVALHQAGVTSTVAICGTVITEEQLTVLARTGGSAVFLLFDADAAGVAAPARNARALLRSGLTVFVAKLPAGDGTVDPDSFVRRRGRAALDQVIAAATPLTEHLIGEALRALSLQDGADAAAEQKLRVVRELAVHVTAMPDGLPRVAFEKAIARRLHLDIGPLRAEFERAVRLSESPRA
jgi:DNA primase